jgi:hypothetical protein
MVSTQDLVMLLLFGFLFEKVILSLKSKPVSLY